jgi:hypothetical protein
VNDKDMMPDRDARIGAYLDGEMPPADRAAFEAEMAADAALAADVARYRDSDAALRAAFGDAGPDTIDHALLARLGLAEAEVVSLDDVRRARATAAAPRPAPTRRWPWAAGGALAAGLAALLVLGRAPQPMTPTDSLQQSSVFQVAMRDLPSASSAALKPGATISPRLTFVAGDGRFCREFEIAGAQAKQVGITCRAGTTWHVETLVTGNTSAPLDGQLHTAGGDDNAALDPAYRRLGASDPVDLATEKLLISGGWKKPAK